MSRTGLVLLLVLVALLGWEGYAALCKDQLISEAVWSAISGRPFIPFLAGFLCGHLFWQKKGS